MLQPFADAHRIYHVIEPALRAPSVHNTQPWSFRIAADDRIELRASAGVKGGDGDGPGRWDLLLHSPAPGPWAREYAISCGAALLNLRLAIRVLGHAPVVTLLPDPSGDPGLLASVEIVTAKTHQTSPIEQELYDAIWQRHTDRWPFSDTPVRAGILVEMERAAAREHGWLRLLHGPFARAWLTVAARADGVLAAARDTAGDIALAGDMASDQSFDALLAQFHDELAQWTSASEAGYGIPAADLGPRPAKGRSPVRDLRLGEPGPGEAGAGEASAGLGEVPRARFERHPQLLMLFTDRDEPTDWLRAGQALQRALLAATSMGVSASFLTQPMELADLAFQYDPRDSHASRLIGPAGHRLPSVHRAVDAAQRTSASPIERRGYVRRHLLGATPWLEVPQMVIRVGYPKDGAGPPDLRTPRAEPDILDARADPPRRVPRPPAGDGAGPDGDRAAGTRQAREGGRFPA
jgi:nitroreductase